MTKVALCQVPNMVHWNTTKGKQTPCTFGTGLDIKAFGKQT